ncbi:MULTISPECIES: HlyD family efflux transporter periplasmic adaptor subunit [unclassified Rhodanobacter]|uniref:Biotin/lipoyl-binding protein n=1 Tax=Rhodanobacter humi TaxID=1888173 RepID=A0ABV4APV0_9GAMM
MNKTSLLRFLFTAVVVLAATVLGHALWKHYLYSPWTRDGRVRADVVQIAPDVAGLVATVPVHDNQFVHKGELLMTIDRDRYILALQQAEANLAAAEASARAAGAGAAAAAAAISGSKTEYEMFEAQAQRRLQMPEQSVISVEDRQNAVAAANNARAGLQQAQASHNQASAGAQQALAAVQQAQVAVDLARLNLQRTEVRAPADGYVTNLDVRVGDYAAAGAARMALIDSHSYYIYGYFEETKLPQLRVGDPVDIRLMAGGVHLKGTITGIARGITDSDNPTGANLLADVNPTFNWVRLAQRVPVRIAIDTAALPKGMVLAAGMTATIEVQPHAK